MGIHTNDKYVDLMKICKKVDPKMFEPLSWLLLLNLDLIPEEDLEANPNLRFSHDLMEGKYEDAKAIAQKYAQSDKPIAKHYKELLDLDPELEKTIQISQNFFALAKKRIELIKKLGIKQF
ncbi:MAG: hypothetical protein ACTSSG_01105 [Candidatus Heimdallarchaeaceae archaeon]